MMTWPQLLAILLTGVFAIASSASGQMIAGRITRKRDEQQRRDADRHRFTDAKRELYLEAIGLVSRDFQRPPLFSERMSMNIALALYDPPVAAAFSHASNSLDQVCLQLSDMTSEAAKNVAAKMASGALTNDQTVVETALEEAALLRPDVHVDN